MLDRNQLAASILPALVASVNSPSQISQENRLRCVEAAFAWADDFLQTAQAQAKASRQAVSQPLKL